MAATIKVRKNGPLLVQGDFEITDAEGKPFGLGGSPSVVLCRCGQSDDKPFCDGSHARAGFQAESEARDLPPRT